MNPTDFPKSERAFLLTLAGIQFCHILDFMIMMPLGPFLMQALGIDTRQFGLLVASYSFAAAVSGLLAATLVDRFERKRFLLVVFALFGLATLSCALAPDYATLLLARGLAGVFGGIMGAMVQTMVADAIPYARLATAGGVVAAAFSLSTVAGVPLSLVLADTLGWRAPFVLIAAASVLLFAAGCRALPRLAAHLDAGAGRRPNVDAIVAVLRDANLRRAMSFSGLVIFSGFTVIPFITVFAVANVGIANSEVPLIYLAGGVATLFSARLIGRWADRVGKVHAYRRIAILAVLPLLLVTHAGPMPLAAWLVITTLFFVLVSGRMIPAMAIVSAAAGPRLRGTFMSLNATLQSLAMGLASTLAGLLVGIDADGRLTGYPLAGYFTVALTAAALWLVPRIAVDGAAGVAR